MKKHSLLKILGIILLLIVIVTYCVAGRSGEITYLGLGDVTVNYIQSFYYFFDTALFVMVVGGFYGILNKTGAYKKLLDNIVSKVKKHSKIFIFGIIVLFALVSSLTGISIPLFIFVPFVVSIILLLGYDKLVAMVSTIGSILVGFIGGIFVTFRDPNSYYSVYYTTFEEFVGADKFSNWIFQLVLLILGVALLIFYVNRHSKNVEKKKVKYDLSDNSDVLITEVKGNYKDIKTWPLIVIFALIAILLILGLLPFASLFNLSIFNDFHTWLTGLKISEFAVFNSIISANFTAFGEWASLGTYTMAMIMLAIFAIIIKFIYHIKFNDLIDDFVSGVKKMVPIAALVTLAYAVLVCSYNNGFTETLINNITDAVGGFNIVVDALITMVGSLLHTDLYYAAAGVFTPLITAITDESVYQLLALTFQSFYGLTMLIGPTSILLIIGLRYLDIPYTTWIKFIWRFVLGLFLIIFVVLLIASLI